jgi:hypothetical protein
MSEIKNIKLDKHNGLEDIVMAGSKKQPEIIPGMKLALSKDSIPIHVETVSMVKNTSSFVGKVFEIGADAQFKLQVGDKVPFKYENIAYLF